MLNLKILFLDTCSPVPVWSNKDSTVDSDRDFTKATGNILHDMDLHFMGVPPMVEEEDELQSARSEVETCTWCSSSGSAPSVCYGLQLS